MATQTQLDEARTARHALITGQKMVSITMHGRQTTFSEANKRDLDNYIAELESRLGVDSGRRSRPARVR
jgi:hypothetical protein